MHQHAQNATFGLFVTARLFRETCYLHIRWLDIQDYRGRLHPLNQSSIVCLFVCFGSITAFVPQGQLPREDLPRSSLPPRPLVTSGPRLSSSSLSPRTFVMHPASGPYPPLSSCPVHIRPKKSCLFPVTLP